MRYTDVQIRQNILEFIHNTGQDELRWIIPFCIGYYGCITKQIWLVIRVLMEKGTVE